MAAVQEAIVVGQPDQKWGERPVAVVVPRPGHALALEQLQAHSRANLASFKVPDELVIVTALPRNPSGKALKRELREMLAAPHPARG